MGFEKNENKHPAFVRSSKRGWDLKKKHPAFGGSRNRGWDFEKHAPRIRGPIENVVDAYVVYT